MAAVRLLIVTWIALLALVGGTAFAVSQGWGNPKPVNLRPYVTKASLTRQLGMGRTALAQQANAAITATVKQNGLRPLGAKILSERLDGDRGTVVVQETYTAPVKGARAVTADFTLIFHRTVWTLGNLTLGAPAGSKQ